MKKSVYIIKNRINHKVYIGLSNNPEIRWRNHKQRAREGFRDHPLYLAMRELGIENFQYAVLEKDIENGEERELFWIDFFDSRVPNGYNADTEYKHNASFKDKAQIDEIKTLLKTTAIKQKDIAKKFGVTFQVISDISTGRCYRDASETYPLRKRKCNDYEKIKQLHYSLKYETEKSTQALAKEYGLPEKLVNAINKGECGRLPGNEYPLRSITRSPKLSKEQIELMKQLLEDSTLTFERIAVEVDCTAETVKRFHQQMCKKKEDSTRRKAAPRTCFSPEEVKEIQNLLATTSESIASIARKYNVISNVVIGINNGKTKKYHDDSIEYPIRKHA